jgi:hypothetical protein
VKPSVFDWVKFLVATILASVMLYIHAYVKDLPVMLMGAPYLLMGVDLSKLPTLWGGKK